MNETYFIDKDKRIGQIIMNTRMSHEVTLEELCEGVCTAGMLWRIENGERVLDRGSLKRIFARLGIDVGNYDNFLDYPDYDMWHRRMEIISLIEDNDIVHGEKLLEEYNADVVYDNDGNGRNSIERQFFLFMYIQLIKHKRPNEQDEKVKDYYEEAVKLTIPAIDEKPLIKLRLSPLELNMALEYKIRNTDTGSLDSTMALCREFIEYVDKSLYGKISKTKIFPKIVVCIYRHICAHIHDKSENKAGVYSELLELCNRAIGLLKEKNMMFYLTELLEIRLEIIAFFKGETREDNLLQHYDRIKEETEPQLEVLKETYKLYGVSPYMTDDCYMYRESGIYCLNDVIRIRREMLGISRKELCDGICSERTLMRLEGKKSRTQPVIVSQLLNRLNLSAEYLNMSIVTDSKEAVELYEELRYAANSFEYSRVEKYIEKLKKVLPEHPINNQVLMRAEIMNNWRQKKISVDENIEGLKKAIGQTIRLEDIPVSKSEIFMSTTEIVCLHSLSATLKKVERYDEAYDCIRVLEEYCKKMEKSDKVHGSLGIYEMIMTYVASLAGSMGQFEKSSSISHMLIEMALRNRKSNILHSNVYNIIWNEDKCKTAQFDFKKELSRCIYLCQLTEDRHSEKFYNGKL